MCFEVFFQILIAAFAVFGLYAIFAFVRMTWFVSDNISVCIEVDTEEVARALAAYLDEAKRQPLARGNGVFVLLPRAYATREMMESMRQSGIRFCVVDMENMAD